MKMKSNLVKEFQASQQEHFERVRAQLQETSSMLDSKLREDIEKQMDKVKGKANQILLALDFISMDLNKETNGELLNTLKALIELDKNLRACFADNYKDSL